MLAVVVAGGDGEGVLDGAGAVGGDGEQVEVEGVGPDPLEERGVARGVGAEAGQLGVEAQRPRDRVDLAKSSRPAARAAGQRRPSAAAPSAQ